MYTYSFWSCFITKLYNLLTLFKRRKKTL